MLTFAAADDEILIRAAKGRADDVILLMVPVELANDLASVNLHELNHIRIHADEHVPRVGAYRHARELDVVELPFAYPLVAGEVEDYD